MTVGVSALVLSILCVVCVLHSCVSQHVCCLFCVLSVFSTVASLSTCAVYFVCSSQLRDGQVSVRTHPRAARENDAAHTGSNLAGRGSGHGLFARQRNRPSEA